MKYINIQDHFKKIKTIFLILTIVLLTGCSINYDITINDDFTSEENISIKENIYKFYESDLTSTIDLYKYYNIKKTESTDTININMTRNNSNFKELNKELENYLNLNNVEYDVTETNSEISLKIKFNEIFMNYMQSSISEDAMIDEIRLNITVPLHVTQNNANEVNGDTYTWILNEKNIYNKELSLTMNKSKAMKTFNDNSWILIVFLIIAVISFIIVTYNKIKNRNNGI